ncbi:MAG TPA: hypothetical protein VFQ44_00565 [Streptosporangiaceae bacterium]|nr:hypothetical protein [Streptosporangiaceae bacterium]
MAPQRYQVPASGQLNRAARQLARVITDQIRADGRHRTAGLRLAGQPEEHQCAY